MKNKFMRAATLLMALTLMTSCFVGGTFAKYTTSSTGSDTARVAYWGFKDTASITISDLFEDTYSNVVSAGAIDGVSNVIAPGTEGSADFAFAYTEHDATVIKAPEVAYNFKVTVDASCDTAIKANTNIIWKLDGVEAEGDPADDNDDGTWDALIADIRALSGAEGGNATYAPGTLPAAFNATTNTHTIAWQWLIGENDAAHQVDTAMGNALVLDDCSITITITATQLD